MNKIPNWVDGISIYCEWLYETNRLTIKLTGLDCINNSDEMKKVFLDVSHNMVKLVPCEADYKKQTVRPAPTDGVFNFSPELNFLKEDYEKLFFEYNGLLYKIKIIRNKSEHEPHNLKMPSSSSGSSSYPNVIFEYDGIKYDIKTEEFIDIIIKLNIIFDKIIFELKLFRDANTEKYGEHPYLIRYTSLDYERFNKILKSNLLSDTGKIIKEF